MGISPVQSNAGIPLAVQPVTPMSLPLRLYTPKPPRDQRTDDYTGLDELDRPELDDLEDAPDTERDTVPELPTLDWDEEDGESHVKPRRGTSSSA